MKANPRDNIGASTPTACAPVEQRKHRVFQFQVEKAMYKRQERRDEPKGDIPKFKYSNYVTCHTEFFSFFV